jgi:hypothetical protein
MISVVPGRNRPSPAGYPAELPTSPPRTGQPAAETQPTRVRAPALQAMKVSAPGRDERPPVLREYPPALREHPPALDHGWSRRGSWCWTLGPPVIEGWTCGVRAPGLECFTDGSPSFLLAPPSFLLGWALCEPGPPLPDDLCARAGCAKRAIGRHSTAPTTERAMLAAVVMMMAVLALPVGCDDAAPVVPDASTADGALSPDARDQTGGDEHEDASQDGNADCSPDAPEAWCAYGLPGGRCGDSQWRAVCRDGGWRCEASGGYPGGIPVSQCSGFGPLPPLADGGG